MDLVWLDGILVKMLDTLVVVSTSDSGGSDGIWATIVFFGVGLYLVYDGFGKWKLKRLIEDTPTETVRSVAAGRTELEGVAKPYQETLPAPFTEDECLYVEWCVEEDQGWAYAYAMSHYLYLSPIDTLRDVITGLVDSDRTVRDELRYHTLTEETQSVAFFLDDGTGRVLVRADDGNPTCEIPDEYTTEIEIGEHEETPPKIRQFVEAHDEHSGDEPSLGGYETERRRYTQAIIPVESEVYVLGSALERDDAQMDGRQENLVEVTRGENVDTFLLSNRGETGLEAFYSKLSPVEILGGLTLSAVCLASLLNTFGVA